MSLLSIVRDAAYDLSLPIPTTLVASSDPQHQLLLRIAQEEGKSLAGRCDWQALTSEQTFTTVAADAQTSSIPSDFDRIIPETMYNRTRNRRVWGPISADEWQRYKASTTAWVDPAFRIRGNTILIAPTQTAGETVAYEYISNKWCQTSAGTAQSAWAADTDTGILNEEAMRLGIVWRFRKSKGVEYAGQKADYDRYVVDLIIRDGGRPRLQTSEPMMDRVPVSPEVPDTLDL